MKILIIGLGSIARKHLIAIRDVLPQVEVFAWRTMNQTESPEGITVVSDIENLEVDFVLISNPTGKHYETIRQALTLGCPLFIEKPVTDSTHDSLELVQQIKAQSIPTYVGCNLRFHPTLQFLKAELPKQTKINEVTVYCGSYLPDWRPGQNFRESYSAQKEMGGGVHLDLIHELDYCYWLFGNPLQVRRHFSNASHLAISAFDAAYYHLIYKDFLVNLSLNYFRRDSKRGLEIVFEKETWTVDLLSGDITNHLGECILAGNFNIMQTYKDQMRYFLELISSKDPSMNSIEDGHNVLKMCLTE